MLGAIAFNLHPTAVNAQEDEQTDSDKKQASSYPEGTLHGIEDVAKALQARTRELDNREEYLKEWEERLILQERSIKERVAEYQKLNEEFQKFEEKLAERQKVVKERLVKTFESMKPKKAAEVLTVMEDSLAVELLMAMKATKVATILDKMEANRVMALSSQLAKERKPAGTK